MMGSLGTTGWPFSKRMAVPLLGAVSFSKGAAVLVAMDAALFVRRA